MARLVAVLDANVLYPARLRDLLLRLAIAGLFQARWTATILDECFQSVLGDRPDLTAEQLDRTRRLMGIAVPDGGQPTQDAERAGRSMLTNPPGRSPGRVRGTLVATTGEISWPRPGKSHNRQRGQPDDR